MTRVFICMPYGDHNDLETRQLHTEQAMEVWHRLAADGFVPFCPHLSHYLHEYHNRSRAAWLSYAFGWLAVCDCVLTLGDVSDGMRQEILAAQGNGKPVFRSIESLVEVYLG